MNDSASPIVTRSQGSDDPIAHDLVIVGGGLAGGLLALALERHAPNCRYLLIEHGPSFGGNHRWSWFASDLPAAGQGLLAAFAQKFWDEGYDIAFPDYARTLPTAYCSLSSEDFHKGLITHLSPDRLMLGTRVAALDADGVTLGDGTRIAAPRVVDCRHFRPSTKLAGGWQVFLGQHFKLETPHGLTRPIIMDAQVDQVAPHGNGGAYRFVYVLPLSDDEVFIEDTYYADSPRLDADALRARVAAYARSKGWQGEVIGEETGVLPVISGGDFAAAQAEIAVPGVAIAGARGGFSHPLTSYTLPFAVDNALAIARLMARQPDVSGKALASYCEARARKHWRRMGYYRLLSRMLFEAAKPEERVVVFQHFYALSGGLVERFYAGQSTWPDRLRILTGKPPVAIGRAMRALVSRGIPLKVEKTA
ncbi:MAG: lycopene beta-cyclase CrtY [Erythrobacter sp.]